ncbi:hypothetical protein EVAR_3405_1 [Eumeta japonica]|uniref:Uncharacterized protein n=1 Tax=Eumeta variegata TaxID=151549 RepID=A0A4C1SUP4_EUMVA|nr:hypothetical protein EVAR_3405_1 [Eumeta japonica]
MRALCSYKSISQRYAAARLPAHLFSKARKDETGPKGTVQQKKKRKRKIWVRNWISRRQDLGASAQLLTEMRVEDAAGYKNHLRMLPHQFDFLLSQVESAIQKQDIHMRNAIPAKVKLEVTLRYLATGDSLHTLEAHFTGLENLLYRYFYLKFVKQYTVL